MEFWLSGRSDLSVLITRQMGGVTGVWRRWAQGHHVEIWRIQENHDRISKVAFLPR